MQRKLSMIMTGCTFCALCVIVFAAPAAAQFTVSGTVSDPLAAPVAGVKISLFDNNGNPIGILPTVTDGAGFYSIINFPSGDFVLRFVPDASTGLLFEEIAINVSGNMTVNAALASGHIISGFVLDNLGLGIPDIDLNLRDEDTGDDLETPGDNTDFEGFYDIVVPTAVYRIRYRPVLGENLIPVELRDVSITADTTINVTMLTALTLSGFVTGPGLVPVVNADLDVVDRITGDKLDTPNDNTDGSGFYSILIPEGVYDINVEPTMGEKIAPQEIQNVTFTADMTLNFQLEAGVQVDGRVFDPFGQVVSDVDIDLTRDITDENVFVATDKTDLVGNFAFIAPIGIFTVDFQPPVLTKLAPSRFIGVNFSNDTSFNIDFLAGLDLTGVITNSTGAPVSDVDIDAKDPITRVGVPLVGDHTDLAGFFATVLAPEVYIIEIEPPFERRLAPIRFPALNLSIDTFLNVSLDTGMLVSGVVRDTLGVGLHGIRATVVVSSSTDTVFLPGDKTDSLGAYSVLLAPGTYDIIFKPDTSLALSDTFALTNVVIANDTVIDITLGGAPPPVFTISGTVIEQGMAAIEGVEVSLFTSGGAPIAVPAAVTDAFGQYSISDVLEGTYHLRFDPPPAAEVLAKLITGVVVNDNVALNVALESCNGPCVCCDVAGDANHDIRVNIADVTFLISRIFAAGPAPFCKDEADANADNRVNIADVTFLISRIFAAGQPPICGTTGT